MKLPRALRALRHALPLFSVLLAAEGCSSQTPQEVQAPTAIFDFEEPSKIVGGFMDGRYASFSDASPIEGKLSLAVDTFSSSSEWSSCFKTPPGLLKGGQDYVVEFKCKCLSVGPDSYALFLIRPFDGNDGMADIGQATFSEAGQQRSLKMHFHVPAGVENYSFQVHARKKASFLVDSVVIRPGLPSKLLPAEGDAKPSAELKIPTGCKEFQIDLPKPANALCVSAADFGASPESPDNSKAFNDAIARCKELGAAKMTVPKGVYRFTDAKGPRFEGLSDFEFDGQGSTFVFLKKSGGGLILIESCERALFKDFKVDWDWDKDPLGSYVEVDSVGQGGAYVDLLFTDYENFPRKDAKILYMEQLDPLTMSPGCEKATGVWWGDGGAKKTEWLSGKLLRVYASDSERLHFAKSLKAGQLFRINHYSWFNNAISMGSNKHLTLSGIDIYSCPGAGLMVHGEQHHWQLLGVNIVRPPGKDRPITSSADHYHIGQSLGYMKMIGCEFSHGGDDCLNIHDCSGFGSRLSEKTLKTRNLRGYVASSLHVGDPVELRNDDYSPSGLTSKVSSIKPVSAKDGVYEISFEDQLPEQKGDGFVLFNRRYDSGNAIIRNCYFHDNRARGLLILAHDITIENNRFFHNQMGAVKLETGYTFNVWSEGYGASNVLIRGNLFDNVNPVGAYPNEMRPAIYMSVYLKSDPSTEKTSYPIISDVLIEGNKFVNCPGAIAYACSAKNVIVRNNEIVNDAPRLDEHPYRGAVGTAYSSDVFVTGNKWSKSPLAPAPGLLYDSASSTDVFCWSNDVVSK